MIEQALMASGGIIVLMVGLLLLKKKKTVFWLAIIIAFSPLAYLSRYFNISGPVNLSWINFFAITGIGIVISLFRVRRMYIPKSMILLYAIILLIAFMSAILNHSSIFSFVFSQRNYIMLFSYFAVFRIILDKYNKDEIMGFVVNLAIASSIMAYIQRLVFVTILRLGSGDMVTGLFINDGTFLYYQLISITTVFVYWFQDKHLPHIIIGKPIAFFLMFFTLAIANNKAGLVLIVVCLAIAGFKMGPMVLIKHAPKIVIGVIAFLLILTIYEGYHNAAYGDNPEDSYSNNISDSNFWTNYLVGDGNDDSRFSKSGTLKRGSAVIVAYDLIQKSPANYILAEVLVLQHNQIFREQLIF